MDERLFKAARLGDVVALNTLLEEDPLILKRVSSSPTTETPLHIAALADKTNFAKEMIRMMPSFAWELNQDGFSPMHMASASGNIAIVRELLTLDHKLCLVMDKDGRTPLHYGAIKGRVHVIEELLSQCPKAIEVVTARGETALHLAVNNYQFEALRVLVERLEKMDNHYWELVIAKDVEGNTILELAKSTKQHQVLELLHGKRDLLGLEQLNGAAADLARQGIVKVPPGDHIVGMLDTTPSQHQPDESAQINKTEETSGMQNARLVAAILIATVTYQAGLSPPPSIWSKDMNLDPKCIFQHHDHQQPSEPTTIANPDFAIPSNTCPAITFFLFMAFNTTGFFSSVFLIMLFRSRGPRAQILLATSLVFMIATYVTLTTSISPNVLSFFIIYLITFIILGSCALPLQVFGKLAQLFRKLAERLFRD